MNKRQDNLYQQVKDDYVFLGRILRPHSRNGEVRIILTGCDPDIFECVAAKDFFLLLPDGTTCLKKRAESYRFHKGAVLTKFVGVEDINDADRLRGATLYISPDDRPSLDEDEFYQDELIGLTVIDADSGDSIGKVFSVISGSSIDNIEIDIMGHKFLLPMAGEFIVAVNLDKKTITVRIPPGLVDIAP